MTRYALLLLAAVLLTTAQAAAKGPTAPRTVYGIASHDRQTSFVELDARTLRPVSRPVVLGTPARYLGRSPGAGARAAFAVGESGARIVFVDVAKMKREGAVTLPCAVSGAITWDVANRLVTTCGSGASSVLVVEPVTRKLRSRTPLRGTLTEVRAANGVLAGLLAPLDGIGPARLAVADSSARVRTIALAGVSAGMQVVDPQHSRFRTESPALALSRSGDRAVVVPAVGSVVEIDLARLDTVAHAVTPAPTLARASKELEGSVRHAVWTWSGTVAVSGWDGIPGETHATRAAGVTLIDVTRWTSRQIGVGSNVASNGWSVLGWSSIWETSTQRAVGNGLTGYSADGAERFHLFGDEAVSVATVAGTYAYLASPDLKRYRIVDTESGKVIGNVQTARPTTLFATRPDL
jgi:hypothetical protein